MINMQDFMKRYNISEEKYLSTGLRWDELELIYNHYITIIDQLESTASSIADYIRKAEKVHSVKMRVKDPEHLIEKIIRKKTKEPSIVIDVDNYLTVITDLIGIRVLHLFKEDWLVIHNYITKSWLLHEPPKANIREGDLELEFEDYDLEVIVHPYGYRSIHYLIENQTFRQTYIGEIQVRTIFEEAWSEIDHKMRYPYYVDNAIIEKYLVMFNRLAGSADEMGSFIKVLKSELDEKQKDTDLIAILKEKVDKLSITPPEKETINAELQDLSIRSMSPILYSENMTNSRCVIGEEFKRKIKNSKYYEIFKSIDGLIDEVANFIDRRRNEERTRIIAGVVQNFDLKTENGDVVCRIIVQDENILVRNVLRGRANQANKKDYYEQVFKNYYSKHKKDSIDSREDVVDLLNIIDEMPL